MSVKAILFDHSVLQRLGHDNPTDLENLVRWLQSQSLRWVILATHPHDLKAVEYLLKEKQLPQPTLAINRQDIPSGKPKGAPEWIFAVSQRLGLETWRMVYVGDDSWAWKSALNGGCVYIHAGWSKPLDEGITSAIVIEKPSDLRILLEHLFLREVCWTYSEDLLDVPLHLRCLLKADVLLPGDQGSFKLQHLFTYQKRTLTIGGMPAHYLIMLHALSNLYLEGLIKPGTYFVVYPGHKTGTKNLVLQEFLKPATAFFSRSYYREDWIRRFKDAPDTSLMRAQFKKRPSFIDQTNTVCLDKKSKKPLSKSPEVVVFDDFTTDGLSFEWARNLFRAAGAKRVVLVAIGKYGRKHFLRIPEIPLSPFEESSYEEKDFEVREIPLNESNDAADILKKLLEEWQSSKPNVGIMARS
jgi:hypothetical protein